MESFDRIIKENLKLQKEITRMDKDLKKSIDVFFDLLLKEDLLTAWSFQDEKLICNINKNLKRYFEDFSVFLHKEEGLPEYLIDLFISDIKLSVLKDEAISISKKVSRKENDDKLRLLFDTLSHKDFYSNNVENLETNLYLKPLKPFVELTFRYSKKRSTTLFERFNGFRLINAEIAKKAENKIYGEAISMLKEFIFSFEGNLDSALCIVFFDENTEFLNIHHLARKKYEIESPYSVKDCELYLEILTKVQSPLMKRILMDYCINLEEDRLVNFLRKSLAAYNSLFEKCKQELNCFLNKSLENKLSSKTVYAQVKRYEIIYDLFGKDLNYVDLVIDLKDELEGLTEVLIPDPSVGDLISKEWLIQKVLKKTVTYDIQKFGEAYMMIYNKKKQK